MGQHNFLHLWDDRFLYLTPEIHSGLTARSSATLLVSAVGRPFRLEALDGTCVRCEAALVPPHVPRRLDVDGGGLLSLNVDPASIAYRMLARRTGGQGIQVLDAQCFGKLREAFQPALEGALTARQLRTLSAGLIEAVAGGPERDSALDPRVDRVLRAIRESAEPQSLARLSAIACLSPDRLTHLFAQQVGVSIKRYALWSKVRRSVQQFSGGRRLTDAALDGGFTDAAHMSRTFQNYFGLPPSFLASQVSVITDAQSHAWGHDLAAA
ncbi:AraC family transcriptional regulator [Variovorax sp. J2P1-59]|uniref:helix-turn-helix domain-containing protein n=1 Tax=Variovorax flavidus TaxID=3053501 RepID=UPI002575CD15|nr:AraC family transcriptional regulator [Variovorax sp. J2P1-59]MDM0075622.1 AraC family transcriptional regulator [Variovorax sp. J2P1-59]